MNSAKIITPIHGLISSTCNWFLSLQSLHIFNRELCFFFFFFFFCKDIKRMLITNNVYYQFQFGTPMSQTYEQTCKIEINKLYFVAYEFLTKSSYPQLTMTRVALPRISSATASNKSMRALTSLSYKHKQS